MNILLIIYLTISVILGIVRMVNCCIELNAVEAKWYTIYLYAILSFITTLIGWPIVLIAYIVYEIWLRVTL